jgi:hypothetical protein
MPLAVIRRLGQPAFFDEPIEELLGPAYQAITSAALGEGK